MKPAYLSTEHIEARANDFLAEYTRRTGKPVTLPVPIEKIVFQVFDIPIEWEPISARDGRAIVSKFVQPTLTTPARIILNEDLLATKFRECPGLEQTAMGHEAGHADLHCEPSRAQQLALMLPLASPALDSEAADFADHSRFARALLQLGPMGDDWWREWQAHTFMRFALMPPRLLLPLVEKQHSLTWPFLFDLRAYCEVTISALVVHLEKLRILKVDERRKIHDLRVQRRGQAALLIH